MTMQITPLHQGDAVELSGEGNKNVWEREILPYGKFHYKGREFDITPEWADNAIRAFKDGAVAQTWFHLADEKNSHDVDNRPDRYGGEVIELVKTNTGLTGRYRLTDKAASLVRDNPKLGVSARFTTNYTREADSRRWPVVIDQVLGTLNPRIISSDTWKQVALSQVREGEVVEDASGEVWNVTSPGNGGGNEEKVTLSKEEYEQFKALLSRTPGPGEPGTESGDDGDLDDVLKELEGDDQNTRVRTALSNANNSIGKLQREIAETRFEKEKSEYTAAGVPPAVVELARPILSSYGEVEVVTLSNDGAESKVDARVQVRKILDELRGTVALSIEGGHGVGHRDSGDSDGDVESIIKDLESRMSQFGN